MADTAGRDRAAPVAVTPTPPFWTTTIAAQCTAMACTSDGLTGADAAARLARYGPNGDAPNRRVGPVRAVAKRLLEPLSLILLIAAMVSAGTGDSIGGSIIAVILLLSISLDTLQEGHAARAADILRHSVALTAEVLRDGAYLQVPVEQVVPADVIRVRAGDIIPADALVISSSAFAANEAALTGEPYPVDKRPGPASGLSPAQATGALFRGAVAQTGEAEALVISTGSATLFGAAASALGEVADTSPFERDLHAYGLLTARLTMALVLVVLTASVFLGRPLLQSLLFAVALAVGLTPELLPMITTVTLSRGALRMARRKVIVKRLAAIHDLGAMTVLCTDKTGTLTSAEITLARSVAFSGSEQPRPAHLAAIAAVLGGDRGALDAALVAGDPHATADWTLLGRHVFDFGRRLGSVLAKGPEGTLLIAKGAPEAVLALCSGLRLADGAILAMGDAERATALAQVQKLAQDEGLRTIAVASRVWTGAVHDPATADETALVYEGLCAFADPPKPTAAAAIARLAAAGIRLKILSGDDPVVVKRLAGLVGLRAERVLSGNEVAHLSDDALAVQVHKFDAFGRLAPDQKSRLVRALQARGAVVGYLGDGINDAPALKAAHIGLSVSGASGVAQAAADMILLDQDLAVVADGVEEGRRTFANILKYVRMGASSNFGNMLSMAVASLFLPFLPMLPTQILLNNLLYDLSEIGIPFDSVRPEALARPQVWDMRALVRFAAVMGPLSSLFDLLTFAGLILVLHAAPPEFRTAWFLESMATQILVIFVIRTNGRPWANLPRPVLAATSLGALLVAMIVPFTPLATLFGFVTPPLLMTCGIALLVAVYLVCAELLKRVAMRPSPARRMRRRRA
ncbi:magnesium-translocating P-type ATPase [Novosphingobium sp.]|uniref:magnesium-translocating P-type ATPase n=1 Tax=Novosphingobium sp. TaxID=1874826 RepID=UPI0038BD8B22